MIETALRTLLSENLSLVSRVGTRIYPLVAEQNATTPYLVYRRETGGSYQSHQGSSGAARVLFEFHIFAKTYKDASLVREDIRQQMQGRRNVTRDDTKITGILYDSDDDDFDEDLYLYVNTLRLIVNHEELKP